MALFLKKLACAAGFSIFTLALLIYSSIVLVTETIAQRAAIDGGTPLIVLQTYQAYFPGMVVLGTGLFLSSIALLASLYRRELYEKMLPTFCWIIYVGMVLTLLGNIPISIYWHLSAKNNGYVKCDLFDKVYTTQRRTSFWAKDEAHCNNIQVPKVISGTSMEGLKRANEYLEKQERLNSTLR